MAKTPQVLRHLLFNAVSNAKHQVMLNLFRHLTCQVSTMHY